MVAYLLQLGEDGEYRSCVTDRFAPEQSGSQRRGVAFLKLRVQGALFIGQIAPLCHLDLLRQILGNVPFHSPQDEGSYAFGKSGCRGAVPHHYRRLKAAYEPAVRSKVTRHKE